MSSVNDTRTFDQGRQTTGPASYLLAIDSMSSRRIEVPENGVLHVGRSPDAGVKVMSEGASRAHAKLLFVDGNAYVEDLGSHNGTLVNGERIVGSCALAAGDVIAIADTLLILRSAHQAKTSVTIDLDQMVRRIDQEIARATDYDRPFSVVVARCDGALDPARVLSALRPMDVACITGSNLVALLPELDAHAGHAQGTALLAVLGESACGGLASYPADGGDTATLLSAARSSLAVARAGQLKAPPSAAVEYQVDGRRVLIADAAMLKLYDLVRRLARSDIAVLVVGETGSGKENAAAALHQWSPRAGDGAFVALNCAAVPEQLAESELFGYERGAFSEARAAKIGLLERAHRGTLFLDEVGELSLSLQAKLLRALESKRITRLGDIRERDVDVRIVAATNVDLDVAVVQHRFRQDLLFRLSAATVAIPPLRDRRQEIPLLARMFVEQECKRLARPTLELAPAVLATLARYGFPGNVRELKNAMDFAVATTDGDAIHVHDLPSRIGAPPSSDPGGPATDPVKPNSRPLAEELRDLERRRMVEALEACGGVQTRAAAMIGMPLRTFTLRMRQYGIDSRDFTR